MGGYKDSANIGEKKFWRTRLNIIISLSIIIILCSYATSGNIFVKTQHVGKLLNQPSTATVIYTNNPQIELEMTKIKMMLYVDIALKSLLLVVCISLIVLVCSALKIKSRQEERDELLDPNKRRSDSINHSEASINLSDHLASQVVKEGAVYEAYTEATLIALANDESTTPFNKVNTALYKYGPIAAHKMLFMMEKNLAPEETQYLLKTLGERK